MRPSVLLVTLILVSGNVGAEVVWESFTLRSYDGRELAAQRAFLVVPERRGEQSSRLIRVAVVRLHGRNAAAGVPIVFLTGGPGVPATGIARVPVYFDLFKSLLDVGDVLLMDQRGSGMSVPNLSCPDAKLESDFVESDAALTKTLLERVQQCAAFWRQGGVDLAGYSTSEIAGDVQAARRAIGAPKVKLLAFSYGSEVAFELIRRWPSTVERVVFASTRAPDTMLKLPSVWDDDLDAIGERAGVPLRSQVRAVVERLDKSPVEMSAGDVTLRVGGIGLLMILRADLPDGRAIARIPNFIRQLEDGNYAALATRLAQQATALRTSFNLMTLAVDCSTGWSTARYDRVTREAQSATMRNVNLQWNPGICEVLAANGSQPAPRLPRVVRVPSLFITGELDVNAPPSQTDAIRVLFSNSRHVVVQNAAHETLPATAVQKVVRQFLSGDWPNAATITLPPIEFTAE